jgi:hypothetical protein
MGLILRMNFKLMPSKSRYSKRTEVTPVTGRRR